MQGDKRRAEPGNEAVGVIPAAVIGLEEAGLAPKRRALGKDTALRHRRARQPPLIAESRIERFADAAGAMDDHLLGARGLHQGETEGALHRLGGEREETAAGGGGAEIAEQLGRLHDRECARALAADRRRQPALQLRTDDERREEGLAVDGGSLPLADRERRRHDADRHVDLWVFENIVIVEGAGDRRVGNGSRTGADALAGRPDRRLWRSTALHGRKPHDLRNAFAEARACQCHAERIEQCLLGVIDHGGRHVLEAQARGEVRERNRWVRNALGYCSRQGIHWHRRISSNGKLIGRRSTDNSD